MAGEGLAREAHAAIDQAIAEGHTFGDVKGGEEKSKDIKVGAAASEQSFSPTPDPNFTGDWKYIHDNKVYTMSGKAACFNCGVSLMYHSCSSPRALGGQFFLDGWVPV